MISSALNKLARGTLVYGVGATLQRFISLFLLPFYTSVLTPTDYGAVALISLIGIAMNGLLTLGTGNSMGLLYFQQEAFDKKNEIVWTTVALMTVNGVFWYALIWVISPFLSLYIFQTAEYVNLIRLAFLSSVFAVITEPWLAFLRMEELAKKYVIITVGGALITTSISVILVLFLHLGLLGLFLASALGAAITLATTWLVVGRKIGYKLNTKLWMPLVRIGFPSTFGLFAFLWIDYADRQMIERILGLSHLGIYSVGYNFGMVAMLAVGAFSAAWPPFFMSYINKQEEARQVFANVLTYYVLGFGSLLVFFFLVAKPITLLMTAQAFHEAWVVVGLVATAYVLKGCYLIILPGIYFSHKLKWQSFVEWIAAIINVTLNLYLITAYQIFGAALATFASYLSLPVLAWVIARKYLNVDYQWARLGGITLFISCMSFSAFFFSNKFEYFENFALGVAILIGLAYLVVAYIFILQESERDFLRKMIFR